MRKLLLCLSTLVFFNTMFAQTYFPPIPFSIALKKSADEGKIIFLQFEAADCQQCNEVAEKGLSDKDLAEQVANTFILIKIPKDHPDRSQIATQYNMNDKSGFGSMFIDRNGTLLHKFPATTSFSKDYYKHIDLATNKAGESPAVIRVSRTTGQDLKHLLCNVGYIFKINWLAKIFFSASFLPPQNYWAEQSNI